MSVTEYEYEATRPVEIELDGMVYRGTFRVMAGSVIVYYQDDLKFAQFAMDRPELVARWLLSDLCRKVESRKRNLTR